MHNRFHLLLQQLRLKTEAQFAALEQAHADHRSALQRQLALQLEQRWKIEAQLLLPALPVRQARPVAQAEQDIELLRDLAGLAERCGSENREFLWAVVQRLAAVHFARIDDLLFQAEAQGIDWAGLLTEAEVWLAEWAREIRGDGDIEDEDRDPVGLPPR